MASRDPLYLHKETRLNLEPSSSALVVDIRLPTTSSQGRGQRRPNGSANGEGEEERLFRARNCATTSSVYHRNHHAAPHSFLWRILEDDTVLSVRCIDICKKQNAPDANLILNLRFPQPIRPSCVALADSKEHDTLSIYAIDQANNLYTITLRSEYFYKRPIVEVTEFCKIHASSAFSFKTPHRLVAVDDNLLIVTVHDGGNLKLERNKSHDASRYPWKETFYNSKGWTQNIKGFLKGGHTVKYAGVNMDLTAAASVATTDFGEGDGWYLFTACLDHRLRIWNLQNGQILHTRDLLDAQRNPQEIGKWTVDPSQNNLIKIVGETDGKRLCITYSPIGTGEFKFWKVEAAEDDGGVDISDFFPNCNLIPPPPSGPDVWTLADFNVAQDGARGIQLWVLWKNNITYRVQHLAFSPEEVDSIWANGWTGVYYDNKISTAQISGPNDPTDATEKWLQLIMSPGRFTKATLETALIIYEQGLGAAIDASSHANKGLAESICSVLGSASALERSSLGGMDYEGFRGASEIQWRRFYRLVVELDKQRGEALALSYEPNSDVSWVVCADSLSSIRECSEFERICHNPTAASGELANVSLLISTALSFVDVFSDNMMQICNAVLRSELLEDSAKTDEERIQYFSDKAGFWRQTSDEDCAQVTDAFGQNFKLVTMDLYQRTVELMQAPKNSKEDQHPLTDFGRKLAVKSIQDMVGLQWDVCFSQLILLVHMEFEFDLPEDALHNRLDIGTVYRYLLKSLQRLELVRWLSKTQLSVPLLRLEKSNSTFGNSPAATKRQAEETQVITVLEGTAAHLLGIAEPDSIPSGITDIVSDFCAQDSNVILDPQFIQCALLVRNRSDLALELSSFCEHDPFSTYIQGRVYLGLRDYSTAATYFKKAAYGMSVPLKNPDKHSSGLLDDTEWNLLHAGMPQYYAHIVSLYEKLKAHTYVVEFSRLALEFMSHSQSRESSQLRTDLQSRLFNGAVNISHFELAHSILVSMTDQALQRSLLRALIDKMCDGLHNSALVELPFPNLENSVDDLLSLRCRDAVDVVTDKPWHQILYAWRIRRNDYRGAAAVLLDRIQKLRQRSDADEVIGDDVLDTVVTRQYLMLINVLSCVDKKQAWVTTIEEGDGKKRKVVTLADIRKEYQDELDRIAAIQNNQFGFVAEDEMDVL